MSGAARAAKGAIRIDVVEGGPDVAGATGGLFTGGAAKGAPVCEAPEPWSGAAGAIANRASMAPAGL
ncbi:MAG TPA: hypothetical protein VEJ84_16450 [Acidimicrobiales bacterium]|nr:hypothetical protein [Acidimicrobiales bacterium]